MELNWLSMMRERRAKSQGDRGQKSATTAIERILFIGFGRVPGFHYCDWKDYDWPNAADFEAVFINCATLYGLLGEWKEWYSKDEADFPREPFKRLGDNLLDLNKQILKIINSGRSVFALAVPQYRFQVHMGSSHYGGYSQSVDVYMWCPLPVKIRDESGDISQDVDPRFSEYRKQLKRWWCYLDSKPERLKEMDADDLGPTQYYLVFGEALFENLSLHPLGIELRYGVFDGYSRSLVENAISGAIYLLHYPVGGNLREALRCLLRQFCNADLIESNEPEWLDDVRPPRGAELDKRINLLSEQIDQLSEKRAQLQDERRQLEYWRRLLYESGDMLEDVVFEAFKHLGLDNVRMGPKGDHDIVGELDGEILLFEVKGLTKSVGRREVFDLDRHIGEFQAKNPSQKVAKGVLVANAFCNDPPDTRDKRDKPVFADDAVKHAKPLEFALLDTRALYQIITDVIEGNLNDTKSTLQALRDTVGVYAY